ncbi:MAG TPA: hypothetical protein V6C58_03055 [Allocoleopsis sp.]
MNELIMSDQEIRMKAIAVLNQSLGATATLRFLAMLHQQNTDYVLISQELYQDQTIAEIFDRSKSNWSDEK